ncbi:MAG: hypothetical protein JST93_01600 [Acidobacteria bacterium]|nr:hypothetical protein [Acidobacteriota bacterium]
MTRHTAMQHAKTRKIRLGRVVPEMIRRGTRSEMPLKEKGGFVNSG